MLAVSVGNLECPSFVPLIPMCADTKREFGCAAAVIVTFPLGECISTLGR